MSTSSVWDNDSNLGPIQIAGGVPYTQLQSAGTGVSIIHALDQVVGAAYFRSLKAGDGISIEQEVDGTLEISSTLDNNFTVDNVSTTYNFTATPGQTQISVSMSVQIDADNTHVWINGIKLVRIVDYLVNTGFNYITLLHPLVGGESIEVIVTGSFTVNLGSIQDAIDAAEAAELSAANALNSANAAAISALSAAGEASDAQSAAIAAQAAWLAISNLYLGAFSSNPSVDNSGNPLTAGDFYLNTSVPELRFWTGAAWISGYGGGGAGVWGGITGTLSDQADLLSALQSKQPKEWIGAAYLDVVGGSLGSLNLRNTASHCDFHVQAAYGYAAKVSAVVPGTPWKQVYFDSNGVFSCTGSPLRLVTGGADADPRILINPGLNLPNGMFSFTPFGEFRILDNPGTAGQFLRSGGASNYPTWATLPNDLPTGGTTGQILAKTSGTNYAVGWIDPPSGGGGATWGSITGTLSSQTDLQSALDGKAAASHSHAWGTLTGSLSSQLDLKAALDARALVEHYHELNDIDGLSAALATKANKSGDTFTGDVVLVGTSTDRKLSLTNTTNSSELAALVGSGGDCNLSSTGPLYYSSTTLGGLAPKHSFSTDGQDKLEILGTHITSWVPISVGQSNSSRPFYSFTNSYDGRIRTDAEGGHHSGLDAYRHSNDAVAPVVFGIKSRGTRSSPTAVNSGDRVLTISGYAHDGGTLREVASIVSLVNAINGSDEVSGRLSFLTRGIAAGSVLTEQMRLTPLGQLVIGGNTVAAGAKLTVLDSAVQMIMNPYSVGSMGYIGCQSSHPLAFVTGGTERARFNSTGDFGIGITPAYKLDVNGSFRCTSYHDKAAHRVMLGITVSNTAPASPAVGDLWIDTSA